jgi:hypothetical protein
MARVFCRIRGPNRLLLRKVNPVVSKLQLTGPPGIFREVGNALAKSVFVESFYFACSGETRLNTGEKNGGDDETRTRDLCRDRAAF